MMFMMKVLLVSGFCMALKLRFTAVSLDIHTGIHRHIEGMSMNSNHLYNLVKEFLCWKQLKNNYLRTLKRHISQNITNKHSRKTNWVKVIHLMIQSKEVFQTLPTREQFIFQNNFSFLILWNSTVSRDLFIHTETNSKSCINFARLLYGYVTLLWKYTRNRKVVWEQICKASTLSEWLSSQSWKHVTVNSLHKCVSVFKLYLFPTPFNNACSLNSLFKCLLC